MGPGMMGYYSGYSLGGVLAHVMMLLFWILLIVGIVMLIRWAWDYTAGREKGINSHGKADTALEILKQRYAKGEISREEYQQMKQDLI